MSKISREDLEEQVRINRLLKGYLSMESLTPAMWAQLICGVQPVPDSTDIPAAACQLKTPTLPATRDQLHNARKVLDRFIEECEEDGVELPHSNRPVDFVLWSMDSYSNNSIHSRPEWLDYILTFFPCSSPSSPPTPAPFGLAEHALELESVVSAVTARSTPQDSTSAGNRPSYHARFIELMEKGKVKSTIAGVIGKVMDQAQSPFCVGEIWARLCKMAEEGQEPALQYTGPMAFKVPYGGHGWRPYTKATLGAFLRRVRTTLKEE